MSEESPQGWHSPSTWPYPSSLGTTSPSVSLSPQGFQLPDQDFVDFGPSLSPSPRVGPTGAMGSSSGRDRSRSTDRDAPQVFILDCHGCSYADQHGNPVVVDSLVDTFTSCKFARTLVENLFNFEDHSFFDPPYKYVIPKIVKAYQETAECYLPTRGCEQSSVPKSRLRDIIYSSLCDTRERDGVIVPDSCEFRCHHNGRKISDMLLFGAGAPMDEQVLRLDPKTGAIEDVHTGFGLVKKDKGATVFPSFQQPIAPPFSMAIEKSKRELDNLNLQISELFSHSHTQDNIYKIQILQDEYAKKVLKLGNIIDSLQGGIQGPKFEYTDENKKVYGDEIKLSTLLRIAIDKGTINPITDIVVVVACRTLPGNFEGSPEKGSDESPARGGSSRSKMKRKKIRKSIKRRKYTNCIDMIKNKKNRTRICKRKMQYRYVNRNPKTRKFTI
jgi:hypothetical protein